MLIEIVAKLYSGNILAIENGMISPEAVRMLVFYILLPISAVYGCNDCD